MTTKILKAKNNILLKIGQKNKNRVSTILPKNIIMFKISKIPE